mgnify:CR=1 FL=1
MTSAHAEVLALDAPHVGPECEMPWCRAAVTAYGSLCPKHHDLSRAEPTLAERTLLHAWGWRELQSGRWLVPEKKYARTWREALHRIEKDRAAGDEP